MTRARRLKPVHDIANDAERTCAARVAAAEHKLREAEGREQDLRRYRDEYRVSFDTRARQGLDVRSLREYQAFLAKLSAAIEAQQALLKQLRRECDHERVELRAAITRRMALGKVIERINTEERTMNERRNQRESDERAQGRGQERP
jgi:flagellar FliJ protein